VSLPAAAALSDWSNAKVALADAPSPTSLTLALPKVKNVWLSLHTEAAGGPQRLVSNWIAEA
jgi:hypothetical protein